MPVQFRAGSRPRVPDAQVGDKVATSYTCNTSGLVGLGLPAEIGFHGLLRASFSRDKLREVELVFVP